MTVKDLIKLLKGQPEDAQVFFAHGYPIETITYFSKANEVYLAEDIG